METVPIHEGSAKDTLITKLPTSDSPGEGIFRFTKTISLFDYGRMIELAWKDIAQALVAKKTFEILEEAGIKTHYLGPGDQPNELKVQIVNVPEASKGTGWYRLEGTRNIILPIEIIARDHTHPESSDLKKIRKGELTYEELGYKEMPVPHKRLPETKIAYSTKYESKDRVVTREQAVFMAGLPLHSKDDKLKMDKLENFTRTVFNTITNHTNECGLQTLDEKAILKHYDEKIEVAVNSDEQLMLVDVAGTLDEHRFMARVNSDIARNYLDLYCKDSEVPQNVYEEIKGILDSGKTHIESTGEDIDGFFVDASKQFLRNIYKDTDWKEELDRLEELAKKEGKDWYEDYDLPEPPALNENTKRLASDIYLAHAVVYCGEDYVKANTPGIELKLSDPDEVFAEAWVVERLHERGAYTPFVMN